jgi:hypothetical protein
MRPSSGRSWILLLAASLLVVLAVLRTGPVRDQGVEPQPTLTAGSGVSKPDGPPKTPEQMALLGRIFAAWGERQAHARSFHVTWETQVTVAKNGSFWILNDRLMAGMPSDLKGEKTDVEITFPQSELWGAGENDWRRDFPRIAFGAGELWQSAQEHVVHVGNVTTRLAVPVKNFVAPWMTIRREEGSEKEPVARARAHSRSVIRELNFAPLHFALRPLSDWSPDECRVANENANVYGVPCIEIREEESAEACWVDPKRDYAVVFYEQGTFYNVRSVFIEYQHSPADGWIPSRWTWEVRQSTGQGGPTTNAAQALFRTSVTRLALNENFTQGPFIVQTPPGTQVYDATPDREAVDAARQVPTAPSVEDRKTLEEIGAAWSKRQARFKSFRFTSRREPSSGMGEGRTNRTVSADGDEIAFEFRTPDRSEPADRHAPLAWHGKMAFDGKITRAMNSSGWAIVKSGFDARVFRDRDAYLWLGLRPLDAPFGRSDPSKFRVVSQTAKMDGTPCVLVETDRSGNSRTFAWLDPAREYVLLRQDQIALYWRNSVCDRLEISYRLDPNLGWIPAGWKEAGFENTDELAWGAAVGGVHSGAAETVTEYSVNQPIPPAAFHVDFPQGVRVEDRDAEETAAADAVAARWAKAGAERDRLRQPPVSRDSYIEIESVLTSAREAGKRVLIEFGSKGHPDCGKLYDLLKGNAELSARERKGFALVPVDTDSSSSGKRVYKQYVPEKLRKNLPVICVLDSGGNVVNVDDTTGLKTGDKYDVAKLSAYLGKWSRK